MAGVDNLGFWALANLDAFGTGPSEIPSLFGDLQLLAWSKHEGEEMRKPKGKLRRMKKNKTKTRQGNEKEKVPPAPAWAESCRCSRGKRKSNS